ncbi:alpha/beta hydrolase [Rhizohabitans arisaemae]|uniref:alpha/beta hydrolase n=1 Tax=Rhizohabitans arisaemae TaxID=2720610 RepID=UPI0024B0D8F6|nr:alpha/beta hydrolase [Rhizohabitans arisaemae]
MKKIVQQVAGAATVVLVLGGMASPASARMEPRVQAGSGQPLSWRDCGDGLKCAELTVPADWARPKAAQITLALAMRPARNQAGKQGALVFDMGGPGPQISGFRYLGDMVADLTEWFDLVTFDPRGFDGSSGIKCPIPAPIPADKRTWVFADRTAFTQHVTKNRDFGERCGKAAGVLSGNLTTWQHVRDLEAVRVALGQEKLNYYGNSYGTVYGTAYAEYFPHKIGRMYLDSVFDHTTRSIKEWLKPRVKTDERNLHRFAEWCAKTASCALHGRDLLTVWKEVIARAGRTPIPAPRAGAGATVGAATIVSIAAVGFEPLWADLAKALKEAHAGDASLLLEAPPGAPDPDLSRIRLCADYRYPSDYRRLKSLESDMRKVAPLLGWRSVWVMANHCAGLPSTQTFLPHPIKPLGVPPILIANGAYDHATPPEDGRRLAAQLPGSRYLPALGGHALYLSGHPCVREHVNRYLSTGALPPAGASCGQAPPRTENP